MSAEKQDTSAVNENGELRAEGNSESMLGGKKKAGLLLIVALACSTFALLTALGTLFYLQSGKAERSELRTLRAELKKRDAAVSELVLRVENLTAEVLRLSEAEETRVEAAQKLRAEAEKAREQAATEAAENAEKAAQEKAAGKGAAKGAAKTGVPSPRDKGDKASAAKDEKSPVPPASAKGGADAAPAEGAKPSAPEASAGRAESKPAAAPVKNGAQNCDLVGKSAEEQAATLKRCVSLIDSPPARALPR